MEYIEENTIMRILYIKNGDVVEQLSRISIDRVIIERSGPDAFVKDLLNWIGSNDILMLSAAFRNKFIKKNNVEAYVLKYNSKKFGAIGTLFLRFIASIKALIIFIRYKPKSVICGRTGILLWLSYIYAKLSSIKLVTSRHESLLSGKRNFISMVNRYFDLFCLRRSYSIVCHGPYLYDQLLSAGMNKDKIFEFDISFQANLNMAVDSKSGNIYRNSNIQRTVLYLGRIEKKKGAIALYKAFRSGCHKLKNVRLLYVGSGRALVELKQMVKIDKTEKNVHFRSQIPHHEVFEMINKSYVVVTPTISAMGEYNSEANEARCMTAMESLFMGVPVIAPDSGPFPYLINNEENGLLYETNSNVSLSAALYSILTDEILYENLRLGAVVYRKSMLQSTMTFSEAIHCALE